jgi:hypothetical protein
MMTDYLGLPHSRTMPFAAQVEFGLRALTGLFVIDQEMRETR